MIILNSKQKFWRAMMAKSEIKLGLIILFFCVSFGLYGQSINGIWYYEEHGINENMGEYSITETLTIHNGEYTLISEMTSEYGPFQGWGERGSVTVSKPDIYFRPKEETTNIFSDEWDKIPISVMMPVNTYKYELSEKYLILIKDNKRKVYIRQK
jgi:hypothetical protein